MRGVIGVQIQNQLNDKITQFMLIGLGGVLAGNMSGTEHDTWAFKVLDDYDLFVSFLISLPFVLFAPVAGWFSDRYSKKSVLIASLFLQMGVLCWIAMGLHFRSVWLTTTGFFFLALQSAVLGPARVGICKELVGAGKLAVATGMTQMVSIVGIISGTVIGGKAFSWLTKRIRDGGEAPLADPAEPAWQAALIIVVALAILSVLPFAVIRFVRKTEAHPSATFRVNLFWEHFEHMGDLFQQRRLGLAAGAITFFWFAAGVMALIVIQAGEEIFPPGDERAIEASSYLNGAVGIGVAAGSIFVARICRHCNKIGLSPIGAIGIALSLLGLFFLSPNTIPYYAAVLSMGFFGGLYLAPLSTMAQDLALEHRRGRVISALSLLSAIALLMAVGFEKLLRHLELASQSQYLILAILSAIAAIPTLVLTFMKPDDAVIDSTDT